MDIWRILAPLSGFTVRLKEPLNQGKGHLSLGFNDDALTFCTVLVRLKSLKSCLVVKSRA